METSFIMAKRHHFKPGDWESIAYRLDEIISAHSGEEPFEEALKLLVARMEFETAQSTSELEHSPFLNDSLGSSRDELNKMLCSASGRWPGILEPGSQTRLSDAEISRCAHILNSVSFLAENIVGLDVIFEFLVNKAAKGQKGQYFTPRYVIDEMIRALSPARSELVADPACGSAGFLRHCLTLNYCTTITLSNLFELK
jgi:type I restriction enzyme M protein